MAEVYDPFDDGSSQGIGGGIVDPFQPGYQKPGVVLPALKRVGGRVIQGTGQLLEDAGIHTPLKDIGSGIIERNPQHVTSLAELRDRPGKFAAETIADVGGQVGASAAGTAVGAAVGRALGSRVGLGAAGARLGGFVGGMFPIYSQTYGGIREAQAERGIDDVPMALFGAGASSAVERLGLERAAAQLVRGTAPAASGTLAKRMLRGAAEGALVEAPTEVIQSGIERFSSFQPLTGPEATEEYILSGLAGAVGGAGIGAPMAALRRSETETAADPVAARDAERRQEIAGVAAQAAADPNAGPLTRAVGLNPQAAAEAGAAADAAQFADKVQAADGRAPSEEAEFEAFRQRLREEEAQAEAARRVEEDFAASIDAGLEDLDRAIGGQRLLDQASIPALPPPLLRLPAPETDEQAIERRARELAAERARPEPAQPVVGTDRSEIQVGPAGEAFAVSEQEAQRASRARAEADALSGRLTGIRGPERELVNPKTGQPWNNALAAHQALRRREDKDQWEVRRRGDKEWILARKEEADRGPVGEPVGGDSGRGSLAGRGGAVAGFDGNRPAGGPLAEGLGAGGAAAAAAPDAAQGRDSALTERRTDLVQRKRVADMTPEERAQALLTHEVTGIPNRRAYEEAPKRARQASLDVDSLKWVNDNMGHEAGDQLLRAVATALREEGADAYHISGDEFVAQGDTDEDIDAVMARVNERLKGAEVSVQLPDGRLVTYKGLGVSYGKGSDLNEADLQLQAAKSAREAAGLRAARGVKPPGVVIEPAEGLEDRGREAAAAQAADEVTPQAAADPTSSAPATAVRRPDGTAFPNVLAAGAARALAGLKETHDIVPAEGGGFELRPKGSTTTTVAQPPTPAAPTDQAQASQGAEAASAAPQSESPLQRSLREASERAAALTRADLEQIPADLRGAATWWHPNTRLHSASWQQAISTMEAAWMRGMRPQQVIEMRRRLPNPYNSPREYVLALWDATHPGSPEGAQPAQGAPEPQLAAGQQQAAAATSEASVEPRAATTGPAKTERPTKKYGRSGAAALNAMAKAAGLTTTPDDSIADGDSRALIEFFDKFYFAGREGRDMPRPEIHPDDARKAYEAGVKDREREAQQAAGGAPATTQRGGWRPIGANASGNPLFEDERGVRSYTEGGARITEKVRIIPGRGISIDKDSRGDEFLTAEERAASQAEAQSRDEASRTSAGAKDKKRPQPSANTVFTEEAAAKAREILRRKLGQLNSGIDPEVMQAGITLAGYHIEKGARTFAAYVRAMVADLGDIVKPYLKSWYMGVKYDPRAAGFEGMDDAATVEAADVDALARQTESREKSAPGTSWLSAEDQKALAAFRQRLSMPGQRIATIRDARSIYEQAAGQKAEGAALKRVDELLELAVVMEARDIVDNAASPQAAYSGLVDLYDRQPRLGTRTSTSIENQAYSTPAPLAYIASRLAGITKDTTVLEPTAGNGMLLIAADPAKATANELNQERAQALREQGFSPTTQDAAAARFPPESVDVVIENPPFGVVREADGSSRVFDTDFYQTTEIDHAIALNTLKAMNPDGRAVLIVGGVAKTARTQEARSDAYNGKAKRSFYYHLYNNYNVVDHFTVAGELYEKQGAGWPVDVIVIHGKGKSSRALPAVDVPRVYNDWGTLTELLDRSYGESNRVVSGQQPDASADRGRSVQPDTAARPGVVPVESGAARAGDGGPLAQPAGRSEGARAGAGQRGPVERDGERARGEGRGAADLQQPAGVGAAGAMAAPEQPEVGAAAGAATGANRAQRGQSGPAQPSERVGKRDREDAVEGPQSAYEPQSNANSVGTLVPTNMRTAVRDSLVALEDRVGSIDEFVAQELGYDPAEIGKYFSAEQVDALGLALDQMKSGKGFIIGDQTGIGKGRVVAGVIRYALRNGYIPVFVTEKPNLYADMYRDLTDIGQKEIRPLMTNGGETVPLDEEGKNVLKTPASMKHNADLMKMAADADLGAYNMIFTTYNQMQTHQGKRTARMDLLEAFAPRAIVIFDESHNAGGTDSQRKNSRQKAADGTAKTGRAAFARQLAGLARGVFYSSATYAKRPSVMDLYFKTDMSLAVGGNVDKLPAAIQAGGVPLQQAVAAMLTKAGQYIRRERSFAGVEYNTPVVKVDRNAAETIASIMLGVKQFDDLKEGAVEILKKEAKATASQISTDGSTGAAGAMSTNFTSVMHNLIDQMLLGLKADAAADRAIEALRNGEKPVITVANTMGSFIESYADDVGLKPGDHIALSFKDLLLRYLEKSREVTIKDVGGNSRRRRMTDDELGAMAVRHFNRVRKQIQDATTLDGVPISPIDWIHYRLRTAGYASSEITGRSQTIDYTAAAPTYRIRPSKETSIAGRRKAISDFNSGKLDAIILNQSGSTGLSLHASEKFKDQRRRRMIIAQAEKNIDTHMQMLGRVHRTGQVVPPAYDQLVADIPAEKRPAAVLAKKMASLNANTSAARSSALTSKESIDFLNEYGDEVVAQLMADMPEVHVQLGEPLDRSSDGDGFEKEDAARKVTGRIPMLPVKQQEELYDMIETAYRDRLAQADAMGENALEAKTLDLDARTVSRFNLFAGSEGGSPFAQGADVEVVDVKRLGKPYTSAQVLEMVAEKVGVSGGGLTEMQRAGRQKAAEVMRQTQADYENYRNSVQQKGMDDGVADNILEGRLKMLDVQHDRWRSLASRMYIGGTYRLTMTDGSAVYGLITNIERKKTVSNPVAMGAWRVTFAVADGARSITIPMSKLAMDDSAEGKMHVSPAAAGPTNKPILELFDEGQSVSRERRIIVTGNLLAGFSKVGKGQIAHYTTADGRVQQGILMPRSFNLKEFAEQQPVILEPSQVAPFLAKAPNGIVKSTDGALSVVRRDGEGYSLATPRSKSEGGKYFLNQAIREVTGDFVSTSSTMRATVRSASDLERVLTIVQDELGQGLQVDSYKDEARSVGGKSFGDSIIGGSDQIQADVGESAGGAGRATALRLRKALNDKFGSRNVQNLINRGLLRIVPTFNNLPRETRLSIAATNVNTRRVRGAHDPKTGTVYLVASNIAPSEAASLILHEIGEHYGLKRMLGADYARLLNAVRMQRHRDQDIAAAWRITKERYGHLKEGSDRFVSEVIARLADDASVLDKPLFRRIVDAIRRFLWRLGLVEVNANDIRAMLAASTRRVMRERALGREVSAGEPAAADLSAEEMIEVDGVRRPTRNSLGRLIHPTAEGVRAFWRWFGDSKVVDENGKPLVVYHGTAYDFDVFKRGVSKTTDDQETPGWHFTEDREVAESYAREADSAAFHRGLDEYVKKHGAYPSSEDEEKIAARSSARVIDAYLRMANPLVLDSRREREFIDSTTWQWDRKKLDAAMEKNGHDGIILLVGDSGKREYIAISQNQIKAATGNRGTFDPDEPNIMFDLAGAEAAPAITAVRQKIGDMLDTRRTFNRWWHSTVGTQYHKAQVDPDFGRVFNRAQEYLTDVSRIALAAAEAAPDILPRIDSLRDLARSGASPRELRPVADAIFRGTLEDEKVYTEQELREKFGLNTKQIGLYRQARRAIDRSLTDMLLTEMVKLARPDISDEVARRAAAAASPQEAREILAPYVSEDVLRQFDEKIGRVADLIRSGYAPLMRFGQYTLHVTGADGETLFFGMYESAMERNRMQRLMREQYPEATITAGVMNDESYQMFKGVSPETLELFATATGMDQDEAFQQYLKLTKSNRSALKRLIHRKGIEGYNPDLKRVLAQFITSNARAGSSNLHMGEMMRAWQAIPKEKGDVQKEAGRLIQYIQNPKEEAQALRGFLFYNFLGGSVASAAVNMTQPFTMSFPYLAQWGTARAARELAAGMRAAVGDPASIRDAALRAAMQRAIKEGTVEPHQIYELSAAAMRSEGDWGRFDKAREAVTKGLFLWGRLFSLAEQFNRRSTFAAAFQIGRDLSAEQLRAAGVKDAYEFAVKAVNETQGIYNRGNRPSWARGAVGATLFTFKQFAISYMEFLKRLPRRERALALGVMFLAAGTQGLPGMEDLDDLIDTLLQSLGIATTAKEKRREVIAKVVVPLFGQGAMGFIENGASEFLPIDVQGRLGMGNLLPATGIGLKSTQDKSGEIAEAVGPIGGVIENVFKGASRLSAGDVGGAAAAIAPVAVQNALKGFDMARMGFYRDERGRRVIDTTAADAAWKALGLQPQRVARESKMLQEQRRKIELVRTVEAEIADRWATGLFEGDQEKVRSARLRLMRWNRDNPEARIRIEPSQIQRRLREMRMSREERFVRSAPRELRPGLRAELAQ